MLVVKEENGKIFSPIRQKWLTKTPEEMVRQAYLCVLVNEYGYDLAQIKEEENVTGRGSAQARADFVIYKTVEEIEKNNNPLIIIEVKAEHIAIKEREFIQGELYARMYNAPFFVTHNGKETKFWRVKKDKSPGYREEIENIPNNNATEKEIKALFAKLKVFRETEFKRVLDACHDIIRNNDKLDPAIAFDEITKVLFMKVYAERNFSKGKHNVFTVEWLEESEKYSKNYIETLFEEAKTEFGRNAIFKPNEKLVISPKTVKAIIGRFEKYNLSETSVDTKGIAFENFLGTTFRGELGQFFTPRPVVEFMIDMLNPQEGETVCDPTCGSGGFLIRFFQKVREDILEKINEEYLLDKQKIENDPTLSEDRKDERIVFLFEQLEKNIDITQAHTRLWNLANHCIFGTDANDRMARIAKMNMIMHGDGHGGIHHHDGLVNVDNVRDGAFDIILSNPPFGSIVEDKFLLQQFDVSKNAEKQVQENLFLERFLNLLKNGGRIGVVVPESVLNNPSSAHVREMIEDRAYINAVVSLPQETFLKAGATIICSLLFLQKYTEEQSNNWQNTLSKCKKEVLENQQDERQDIQALLEVKLVLKDFENKELYKIASKELALQKKETRIRIKELDTEILVLGRKNARFEFDYPIFICEPEKVGVTTLGPGGDNHFAQVLEDYQQNTAVYSKSSIVNFANFERWDAKSFNEKDYGNWDKNLIKTLKSVSTPFRQSVSKEDVVKNNYQIIAKINKKGELFLRKFEEIETYKGNLFLVPPNSFIFSKINAKIGCFYYHNETKQPFVVSSEYPVMQFDATQVKGLYVDLALRFGIAQDLFNAKVAGMAKPRINLSEFIQIPIPVPSLDIQQSKIDIWEQAQELRKAAELAIKNASSQIQHFILGADPI